ncbi:hypothetical protein AVEN_179378-1 [Araneus ventricosus]|uniref:Uncharacterized protein n=1 Tax=Araneus ventricosus TaxID=182803 RepID=A0A4Y2RZL4_ARAVE|nr:hypothetical protein AVEN_58137-1 [Araneus ventricosus]GBN81334.1 hypothetical protein AVEN_179378-1 [Araneus ventricosus]
MQFERLFLKQLKRNLGADATMPQVYVEPLTYLELYQRRKALVNISWRHPPAHPWYRSEGPGASIRFKGDRKDQTALARLFAYHPVT